MPLPTFTDLSILYASQLNAVTAAIPTKMSQLVNDMNYLTSSSGPVTSVAGRSGVVTLTYADIGGLATVAHTGSFSDLLNTPTIPNNTNQLVNGANFVNATTLAGYAPLTSPALTGSPTAPTQSSTDSSTLIATTAYVKAAIQGLSTSSSSGSVTSVSSTTNAITIVNPTSTPALTLVPGNIKTSTLNNDALFLSTAVTSVSSTTNLITVANGNSTAAITFVPAALFTLTATAPTASRTSTVLLNDGTHTGKSSVSSVLGLIQPADLKGILAPSGSIVNYFALTGNTTGNQVVFSAVGADADIDLALSSQGNGAITLNGYTYAFNGLQVRQSLTIQSSGSPFYSLHVDQNSSDLLFQNASFVDYIAFSQNGDITAQGILNNQGGEVKAVRVFTGTGNITMATSDRYIIVNKDTGEATTVTLVDSPTTGTIVTVKDGKGDAATNHITVTPASGNIDGGTTWVISVAYQPKCFIYNGTSWSTVV